MSATREHVRAPRGDHHRPGRRSLDGLANAYPLGAALPAQFQPALSPLERTLLQAAVGGRRVDELATELGVSREDAENELGAAVAKLGTESVATAGERLAADDFVQRLCVAFDEVLAPVFLTLDNLEAYIDARLAPDDFAELLAAWVGADHSLEGGAAKRRALIIEAVAISRLRGTARGLQRALELFTGGEVEIEESGGSAWSRSLGADDGNLFDDSPPSVTVRIRGVDAGTDEPRLRRAVGAVVTAATPAHVPATVELSSA